MRSPRYWAALLVVLLPLLAIGEDYPLLEIQEKIVELHTSPGMNYPVFEVAEQGEHLKILRRRSSWLQVQTDSNKTGWVPMTMVQESLKAANLIGSAPLRVGRFGVGEPGIAVLGAPAPERSATFS